MAVYGYDKYGAPTTYGGATFAASGFDLSPVYIQEQGYGTVTLQWRAPDASSSWSRIRLVRSQTGFPVDESDGLAVREIVPASPSATHTDTGLTTGVHYYYGFFVETDLPTYSSTVTYNKGQVAKSVGNVSYVSIVDGNVGNAQTNTAYWAPINILKRWVLAGRAVILTSKRFEHTSRLYLHLPPYYRQEDLDWEEPAEQDKTVLAMSSYPDLAKFLAIFGWALDGIQTRYENISRIQDPKWTPAWYLEALSNHLGLPLETSVTSRSQRVRLDNAATLARSRGTIVGLQDEITASLGYDATVTVGVNKVLSWDQAEAHFPEIEYWDAAQTYAVNDYVRFGGSGTIYRNIVAARGTSQAPPNGGSNTWWTPAGWNALANSVLYNPRYGSKAGWIPSDRSISTVSVLTGASHPVDSSQGNTFSVQNIAGTTQTVNTWIAERFNAPAYSAGTQYVKGELVTYNSQVWEAVTNSLAVTPGADPLTWRLFYDRVPSAPDPQAVFENAIPVTPSVNWTFSVYVATVTGLAGASANVGISWYTSAGAFISTSTGSSSAITGSWTRRTVTAAAPSNAKYAIMVITGTSVAASGQFIFKCAQMEQAAAASTYVPPRQVNALIKPDRVNLYTNPASRTAATGYTVNQGTGTAALARQTGQTGWPAPITTSARATWSVATGSVGGGIQMSTVPISPSTYYTVSIYVRSNKIQRVQVAWDWQTSAPVFISQELGPQVVLAANTVTRLTFSALSPVNAANLVPRVTSVAGTSASNWAIGDWIEVSAVLVEKTDVVKTYFDGASTAIDTFWAGTADASKSFYYQGYAQRRYRLNDIIKRAIPHGVPFTSRYADV